MTRITLPLWWQYRGMSLEQRDEIYLDWCHRAGLAPDLENTVDEFFDCMDHATAQEPDTTEDLDLE